MMLKVQGPVPTAKATACAHGAHRAASSGAVPRYHLQLTSTHTHTTLHARLSVYIHASRPLICTHTHLGDSADTHTFGTFCSEPLSMIFLPFYSPECYSFSFLEGTEIGVLRGEPSEKKTIGEEKIVEKSVVRLLLERIRRAASEYF